jgi:hypothetical protein
VFLLKSKKEILKFPRKKLLSYLTASSQMKMSQSVSKHFMIIQEQFFSSFQNLGFKLVCVKILFRMYDSLLSLLLEDDLIPYIHFA